MTNNDGRVASRMFKVFPYAVFVDIPVDPGKMKDNWQIVKDTVAGILGPDDITKDYLWERLIENGIDPHDVYVYRRDPLWKECH